MYALVVVGSVWQALSLLRAHYSPIGARSNYLETNSQKWYLIYRIHSVELVLNQTFNQIVPWKLTPLPYWIYTVEHRCVPSLTIMEGLQKEDK